MLPFTHLVCYNKEHAIQSTRIQDVINYAILPTKSFLKPRVASACVAIDSFVVNSPPIRSTTSDVKHWQYINGILYEFQWTASWVII